MNLLLFTLTLSGDRPIEGTASQLRGYFATKFNEYLLLHQHLADKFLYRYPLVQYKFVDKHPMIIGINDGAKVLEEIFGQYHEIRLGRSTYQIVDQQLAVREEPFGLSDKYHLYEFVTPWIGLNQMNYVRYYQQPSSEARHQFLNQILTGNLLSLSKGVDYIVPDRIKCDSRLTAGKGRLKDTNVMQFTGQFYTNFLIPDYLGIGKSVSRGFGAIKQILPEKELVT